MEKPEEEADLGKMVKIPALDMLKMRLLHPCGDVKSAVEFRQSWFTDVFVYKCTTWNMAHDKHIFYENIQVGVEIPDLLLEFWTLPVPNINLYLF